MKILICGGHLTPALALIEHLPKDMDVLYVGRKHALEGDSALSLEYQTITSHNIAFAALSTGRLQRTFTKYTLPSLFKLPIGFTKALQIVRAYTPDVVVGFGGYVSLPLCFAAKVLNIPIVIHEQTFGAGLANRLIARFANTICISWNESMHFFPMEKTVLTGNPAVDTIIKKYPISNIQYPISKKSLRIVVVGGSLGSHTMNTLIEDCLPDILQTHTMLHQTGAATTYHDYDRLEKLRNTLPTNLKNKYHLTQFIDPDKIVETLSQADIVISRAGINTITTLFLLNKPSIIIPLPTSQNNEQQKNAQFLASHHLAEILEKTHATPQALLTLIEHMTKNLSLYKNSHPPTPIQKSATDTLITILRQYGK